MVSFLTFLRFHVLDDDFSDSREYANTYSMDTPVIDRNEVISRQFEDELSRVGFARVLSSSDGETTICWNAYSIQVIFQIKAHSVEVMSKLCLLEQDKLCVF